jgi:hypothetical protein
VLMIGLIESAGGLRKERGVIERWWTAKMVSTSDAINNTRCQGPSDMGKANECARSLRAWKCQR